MNTQTDKSTLAAETAALRGRLDSLEAITRRFPEATKSDVLPKLDRLETMLHALERDVSEFGEHSGPNAEKIEELKVTIDSELRDLHHEVEALASGNPTTINAVLDATVHAVEKAGHALKKMTGRVPTAPKTR